MTNDMRRFVAIGFGLKEGLLLTDSKFFLNLLV